MDDFPTFEFSTDDNDNCCNFTDLPKNTTSEERNKFINFLENNLNGLVTCPLSLCAFTNPVLASDGFLYEQSAYVPYLKSQSWGTKSSMTRKSITKNMYNFGFANKLIDYCDELGLELTKNKLELDESFENNFETIVSAFASGNYDFIYKFKEFALFQFDVSNVTFLELILKSKIIDANKALNCYKYILSNAKSLVETSNGNNILHIIFRYATLFGLFEMTCNILKEKSIDIDKMNVFDKNNRTPVSYGFERIDNRLFDFLVGSSFNYKNDLSRIAYCCMSSTLGTDDYTKKVISLMDNVNIPMDNENPYSILFYAIHAKNMNIIKFLIEEKGADTNLCDTGSRNAYMYACTNGNKEIINYMLSICTDLDHTTAMGWKLIHCVCYYGYAEHIYSLLEQNLDTTQAINQFENKPAEYLPLNLVELNKNLSDAEREQLVDYMSQLLIVQMEA